MVFRFIEKRKGDFRPKKRDPGSQILADSKHQRFSEGRIMEQKIQEAGTEIVPVKKKSESEIESLEFRDSGNVVKFTLEKLDNRTFKFKIYFNGNEIKQTGFIGSFSAKTFWSMILDNYNLHKQKQI